MNEWNKRIRKKSDSSVKNRECPLRLTLATVIAVANGSEQ